MTDRFPTGVCALHPDWPEARFNVSGMFCYHGLLLSFMRLAARGFECQPLVESIHGAPPVMWNGGRIYPIPFNMAELGGILDSLHHCGIGCFLTFTNHLLDQNDLADPACNQLLDIIAQRPNLNGVIVASDLLSRYIAGRYPALRQVASIVKVTMEKGPGDVAYYRELGKRFYRYVVHPDDCHNPRLLDQLDREKAEVIVNENCLLGCPMRPHHYQMIAQSHKQTLNGPLPVDSMPDCPSTPLTNQFGRKRRNCNFTRGEMKAVYDMGFRHFKLQGRRDNIFTFAYDLVRYTLEPDFAAPLVYRTLCPLIGVAGRPG